ncbi:MAG: RNA 2',3'-cyclic phosphodiesterase, partial [Chloroflexi bacterium]|nr:RNA 2',3'-cyclic phosphodiesterase [Chloroflexota bacterium]
MPQRLFVAITLPESIKGRLGALKTAIPGATWVKPPTFHLTLRFLGDQIRDERVAPIQAALATVRAAPFTLAWGGVGRFPPSPKKAARVLWVGLTPEPGLQTLYHAVESALATVDFPPEDRDFNPHITVARLKTAKHTPEVEAFLTQHADLRLPPVQVTA